MEHKTNYSGLGIVDVVQIVLIMFKIFHVIDWPWKVVLIPLWATLVFVGIYLIAFFATGTYKNEL